MGRWFRRSRRTSNLERDRQRSISAERRWHDGAMAAFNLEQPSEAFVLGLIILIPFQNSMHTTSTLTKPDLDTSAVFRPKPARAIPIAKMVEAAFLLVAAVFFALHFVHLRADFPNHSPWMDWAKYTDEGWYGDAAIRHYLWGHWNVPGDFNPAAALPVWPALEMVLFHVTGVSLVAARALTVVVFGLILVCCYVLIRRWPDWLLAAQDERRGASSGKPRRPSLAPAVAVLLLAVSPFCFAFMRLAILEPLMILLTLIALLIASSAGHASAVAWSGEPCADNVRRPLKMRCVGWLVALGLILPLIVLTKTTGIFLFPAIFWMLWASSGYRVKPFRRAAVLTIGIGASIWGAYYGLFVRPRYVADYHYLFSANAYTGLTLGRLWSVLDDTLFYASWIGKTLFALALAAVISTLAGLCVRRIRGNPLTVSLLFWIFGYGAFLAYHDNLQPRYYLVVAVPLTMLVAIVFDAVLTMAVETWGAHNAWAGAKSNPWLVRLAAAVSGAAVIYVALSGGYRTVYFAGHPEYTFLRAANQVRDEVEREATHPEQGSAGHSRLLLSISGSDISLMTGLPSICDDFGTMALDDRVAAYKPGWFATWNNVEDDKMEALAPMYRLVRVATIPAFDDPERNLLILYRLDELSSPRRSGGPGRRRSMAAQHRLRTKLGQQPNTSQLKH